MKKSSHLITVLLADDHTVFRDGLHMLLEAESDIQVVAEARDGREAVQLVKKHKPDVVVMDVAMPHMNGLEATRQIMKSFPATKILILSAHNDDEYVHQMIAMGVRGYLIKQSSAKALSKAIHQITNGNDFFSPDISKRFEKKNKKILNSNGVLKAKNNSLSVRESEVLQLIAEGSANKEIASQLEISIKTVEKHRQNLMEKLNIHDTAGLTRYAISTGVIEANVQIKIH